MKGKVLLTSFILMFSSSFTLNVSSAYGEPADIFKPIISDLKKELPLGLSMRLPSYIPTGDTPLYPFVETEKRSVIVNIGVTPDCKSYRKSQPCVIGAIAALAPKTKFPPKGVKLKPVNLDNGIKGSFFTVGSGEAQVSYITWKQDKQRFAVGALSQAASEQELTKIAKSATKEQPITGK